MALQTPLLSFILISMLGMSACSEPESSSSSGRAGLIGTPEALGPVPDNDPVNTTTSPASPAIAAIVGLWNNSVAESAGGEINVIYLEITPAGVWNNFDYRGDNVDLGQNCYVVGSGQISALGGTNYLVTFPEGVLEFSAVVVDGRLQVTGNIGTVTLPATIGLSSTDFNLC